MKPGVLTCREPIRMAVSRAARRRANLMASPRIRGVACLVRESSHGACDGESNLAASFRRRLRADTRTISARWASVRRIRNCSTGLRPNSSRSGWSVKAIASADHELRNVPDGIDRHSRRMSPSIARTGTCGACRGGGWKARQFATRSWLLQAISIERWAVRPCIPYIDPALFQSSSKRTWLGKPDSDPSTWRRSVYVFSKRSIPLPMLEVFDKPDSVGSCARRNRSTIAPQALILMNNSFVLMEAKHLRRSSSQGGWGRSDRASGSGVPACARPQAHVKRNASNRSAFCAPARKFCRISAKPCINLNEFAFIQ